MILKKFAVKFLALLLVCVLVFICVPITTLAADYSDTGAYGYRIEYSGYSCAQANNKIGDRICSNADWWGVGSTGFVTISSDYGYNSETSLKVSGSGTFKKRITGITRYTWYYLSLWGMGTGTNSSGSLEISDIDFGIMDTSGYELENIFPDEYNKEPQLTTDKQKITIHCQDGSWYNRIYKFYSGNNTTLDFFIRGTVGTEYFDEIRLFKVSDAVSTKQNISDITVSGTSVSKPVCADSNNLFTNGDFSSGEDFWSDFVSFGKFVEVATSRNNELLHYQGAGNNCYYLPCVTIDADVSYTCSFWAKNISGSGTRYGIVSLNNPKGFISDVVNISSNPGKWRQYSVTFTPHTQTDVAFAIYDVDGEAVFDKIRLFESVNGIAPSLADTPVDNGTYIKYGSGGTDPVVLLEEQYAQQMSLDSSNASITYDDSFWDYFGENLIPDPTVAAENFNTDGSYKRYSKITSDYLPVEINENHWWDKYVDLDQGFTKYYKTLVTLGDANGVKLNLGSPDGNGYYTIPEGSLGNVAKTNGQYMCDGVVFNPMFRSPANRANFVQLTGSLTDDGSGVICTGSPNDRRMPLSAMEADSYYIVKCKMKGNGSSWFSLFLELDVADNDTRYGYGDNLTGSHQLGDNTRNLGNGHTDTVVFLVYTGEGAYSDPCICTYGNCYLDDFGVYEVSAEYAADQTDGVKLTDPRAYLYSGEYGVSNGANYNGDIIYNVGDIDLDSHSKLGANLITDPTVSAFEDDVYSASGWWSKVVNVYHGTPGNGGNVDNGNYLYASPAYRGLVKSDTSLSHTNDGSGAIKFVSPDSNTPTNKVLLPIEALDSYSYYVLSFWIKSDNPSKTTLMFGRSTTVTDGICSSFGKLGTDWQRIIAIIYTGDKNPSKSYLRIDTVGTVTVLLDDFGLYKINDMEFGELCMDNNYLIRDGVSSGITAADLDANGTLNAFDVIYYRKYLLGSLTLRRADMNGDGKSDIRDLVRLKKKLVS